MTKFGSLSKTSGKSAEEKGDETDSQRSFTRTKALSYFSQIILFSFKITCKPPIPLTFFMRQIT